MEVFDYFSIRARARQEARETISMRSVARQQAQEAILMRERVMREDQDTIMMGKEIAEMCVRLNLGRHKHLLDAI